MRADFEDVCKFCCDLPPPIELGALDEILGLILGMLILSARKLFNAAFDRACSLFGPQTLFFNVAYSDSLVLI